MNLVHLALVNDTHIQIIDLKCLIFGLRHVLLDSVLHFYDQDKKPDRCIQTIKDGVRSTVIFEHFNNERCFV